MSGEKKQVIQRRVALTVSAELDEVLDRLSVAYKKPKATIITGILNDALPALRKMATVSEKLAAVQHGVTSFFKVGSHGSR